MIIHFYCIQVFIYICYDEFHWGKKGKMRGGGAKKNEGGYAGEGLRRQNAGGCEKNLRGRYAGEGKEDKMRGGGGGGCEKFEGGYSGEGKEDKIWGGGVAKQLEGGGYACRRG